jgi:hypothetical protein
MENKSICICGNLDDLANDIAEGKPEGVSLTFRLWKKNCVFYMSLSNQIQFEVKSCWICGGLELGIKESTAVIDRLNCNCELLLIWTKDDRLPIIFDKEFNEVQLTAYDELDGKFPLIMEFCPLCSGILPKTSRDFGG